MMPSPLCLYLDDRTITASSAPALHAQWTGWDDRSRRVGLIENHNKVCVSLRPKDSTLLSAVFPDQALVAKCARALGAVTVWSASEEQSRIAASLRTIRLLSTMGLPLAVFLRTVGQFALSKASFGWTKTVCDNLWTACWVAAAKVRYRSPLVRSTLFGEVIISMRCGALLRYSCRFQGCPAWSLRFGTPVLL